MTIKIMSGKVFENPANLALENLELTVRNDGVIKKVPAVDSYWVERRPLPVFVAAPQGAAVVLGALQTWKEFMQSFIEDLKWMLSLEYHKFWSHILHYPPCMDMLVSFLQEASPPYLPPHSDPAVRELYHQAYRKVLVIFSRIVTNKESAQEWMNAEHLGKLIYDNFIFTIPIICDICLLYGTNNKALITKMLSIVFQVQPKYYNDLRTAASFLKQVFTFVGLQIDSRNNVNVDLPTLPDVFKGFSQTFGGLQSKSTNKRVTLTLTAMQDLTLHLLDCSVTIKVLLELHPPVRKVLRNEDFHTSIVNLYENTIPMMYEKALELGSSDGEVCDNIYAQLDLIRAELVNTFRFIIATTLDDISSSSPDIENNVNIYLSIISDTLSEIAFIKDYNSMYPVDQDLEFLCNVYSDLDPLKYAFIIQAIISAYDDNPDIVHSNDSQATNMAANGPISNGHSTTDNIPVENNYSNEIPEEAKTSSLISEVKDILPHLGDGFILKCLEHYGFNSERVINSVLEGNLDPELQELDPSLPIIPMDVLDQQYLETGIDRLNVFDNDEFDVMTRDNIDTSRVHKGKKKSKHRNLSEMLNDKSHVREMKDMYTKFSLVSDEVDLYDDEYDDTYDGSAPDLVGEPSTEADRKLFKSRPLNAADTCLAESEEEEEASTSQATRPKDAFCDNPEDMRARYQARRDMKYGAKTATFKPPAERDVVGKAKGQGQDKDVLLNRQKKAANKGTGANHNRRTGAQWKRGQGMLPS